MYAFDPFVFFYGASAMCYLLACLMCGLQLCFGIFYPRPSGNIILSRTFGIVFLVLAGSALCYILAYTVPRCQVLWDVGNYVDYAAFAYLAYVGYVVVFNKKPPVRILMALEWPFVVCAILFFCFPSLQEYLLPITGLIIICDCIYYSIKVHRREQLLDDLYSNPEGHSLKWLSSIIVFLIGWLGVYHIFGMPALEMWQNMALYVYMTVFVLFFSVRIGRYEEPVKPETEEQMESMEWKTAVKISGSKKLSGELLKILEEDKVYLNPNLTLDDVAASLHTSPANVSSIIHNNLNTNFCSLVNSYRVEYSKELLKSSEYKIDQIGALCGFNSRTSFYRAFSGKTGKTPTEWREL